MSTPSYPGTWWDLHIRRARGESLSAEEQRRYDQETSKQDHDATPLQVDLETLRKMRSQALALAATNSELRSRLAQLEAEIEAIERSLGRETREALGVVE